MKNLSISIIEFLIITNAENFAFLTINLKPFHENFVYFSLRENFSKSVLLQNDLKILVLSMSFIL